MKNKTDAFWSGVLTGGSIYLFNRNNIIMLRNPLLRIILIGVAIVVIVIGCGMVFSSCQVLKKKRETGIDSTRIAKIDSGSVKKNEVTTKTDAEWWREIINFMPKDTIINNVTTPVSNYYPTQYIREGGTVKQETKAINYDSLWNSKMDSLVYKLSQTEKSKETKVLGFWQILAIAGGVGLIFFIIGKFKINLK